MFLVGLSVDPAELRERGHAALLVSHVSIALPLFLGAALAVFLYPRLSSPAVGFTGFALFMGAAMSITAFPVLARILSEHNMLRSPAGTLATACAAVDDLTGWSLLAFVVVIVRGNTSETPPWLTFCGGAAFAGLMIWFVRPLLRRILPACDPPSDRTVAICVGLALASAAVTELLGIHLLFGAFLAGAIMPRRPELVDWLVQRLESITLIVLLPLFFAVTGLRTSIGLVNGADMWGYTALIVLTAIAGKLGGSMIAARCTGLTWREGALLGALMNTRGLMELVALNIGLEAGVISPAVYSMMVIMALVTTMMTVPLVRACAGRKLPRRLKKLAEA
jgi:Kef-type K+ transport system membrane component KefB